MVLNFKQYLTWVFIVAWILVSSCSGMVQKNSVVQTQDLTYSAKCKLCHLPEYESWQKTVHAASQRITAIQHTNCDCADCHENVSSHLDNPSDVKPPIIKSMSSTEKNLICGKCHYKQEIVGRKAINPHDKHGLLMNVGFESKTVQLDCLQCHSIHGGKPDMLKSLRANACFRCHKEAIITMGVFQPVNYLVWGKACFGCHTVHGGNATEKLVRMTSGIAVTCVICHPTLDLHKTWY